MVSGCTWQGSKAAALQVQVGSRPGQKSGKAACSGALSAKAGPFEGCRLCIRVSVVRDCGTLLMKPGSATCKNHATQLACDQGRCMGSVNGMASRTLHALP